MKELVERGAGWLQASGNWMSFALSIASFFFAEVRSRWLAAAAPAFASTKTCFASSDGRDNGAEARMRTSIERLKQGLDRFGCPVINASSGTEKERCELQHLDELVDEEFLSTVQEFASSPLQQQQQKEITELREMVAGLYERERKLELQLLQYCGHKEQQATVRNLENNLRICEMESKLMGLKVESLEVENRALRRQLEDYARLPEELEGERRKLAEMEAELEELRRENERLAEELESDQVVVGAPSWDSEYYSFESNTTPSSSNTPPEQAVEEQLAGEIERLKTDHCSSLEELVYLRWVNACLRHELRKHTPPPGTTAAMELNHNLSHTSRDKAKQLVLQYANDDPPAAEEITKPAGGGSSGKPKLLGKLKSLVTFRKGGGAGGNRVPSSSASSSGSYHDANGRLSTKEDDARRPGLRCRSDLGTPGKHVRMGSMADDVEGGTPERMKLSRLAGALQDDCRPPAMRRSASFTTSA